MRKTIRHDILQLMLYIVATPIGNLGDISFRAIDVLKHVDRIICEDTRRTRILLNHYEINKPLLMLNDYNEKSEYERILESLKKGENLALVSDAGTPLINDPGYKLVRACIENNIEIDSIPGACSPIVALTLSGLPPDKFTYLGYLPEKASHAKQLLEKIKATSEHLKATYILFVSPYKIKGNLACIVEVLGDIDLTLTSEITKIHQGVETKKTSQWQEHFSKKGPKGEMIALFNIS